MYQSFKKDGIKGVLKEGGWKIVVYFFPFLSCPRYYFIHSYSIFTIEGSY